MSDKCEGFEKLGLDARIIKALLECGFIQPTTVQKTTIGVALEKKDILLRAKTGSGKTLAFLLPMIENILRDIKNFPNRTKNGPRGIVFVPTRELVNQIGQVLWGFFVLFCLFSFLFSFAKMRNKKHKNYFFFCKKVVRQMIQFCDDVISCFVLRGHNKKLQELEAPRLKEFPDIIVCTPSRLADHLKMGNKLFFFFGCEFAKKNFFLPLFLKNRTKSTIGTLKLALCVWLKAITYVCVTNFCWVYIEMRLHNVKKNTVYEF